MSNDADFVIKDKAELKKLFERAKGGEAEAQYLLGMHFENAEFDEEYDEKIAAGISDQDPAHWMKKAAEQGHADAQYKLGNMYRNGYGVRQSDETALKWYRKAAARNHGWALWDIATVYYRNAENNRKNFFKRLFASLTGDKNVAAAIEWYEKVIADGDNDDRRDNARYRLAKIYREGELVKPDREKALKYLRDIPDSSRCARSARDMLKAMGEAK